MRVPEHFKETSPVQLEKHQYISYCSLMLMAHLMNSNDVVTIRNSVTTIMCPVTPAPGITEIVMVTTYDC